MENLIVVNSAAAGNDLHNHWDSTVKFITRITCITDLVCSTGGVCALISIIIHFWKFRHGQKRHAIKENCCIRLSKMILRQRMKQYFNTNPLGPAGVARGITWIGKCPESLGKELISEASLKTRFRQKEYCLGDSEIDVDEMKNVKINCEHLRFIDSKNSVDSKSALNAHVFRKTDTELETHRCSEANIKQNKIFSFA